MTKEDYQKMIAQMALEILPSVFIEFTEEEKSKGRGFTCRMRLQEAVYSAKHLAELCGIEEPKDYPPPPLTQHVLAPGENCTLPGHLHAYV